MVKRLSDEATKKRLRAGRLLLKGKKAAEVALKVGVARQTCYYPQFPRPSQYPSWMSMRRCIPRQITVLPGGGSLARAR
jgi:hypothetical protein